MITKDTKLRFWCQKVLPAVYDDSLSYYELLAKVVKHLNTMVDTTNTLVDFVNDFAGDVQEIINQMISDGEFSEIISETLGGIIAEAYDPNKLGGYSLFDFAIYESKLYRCTGSTSGNWDSTKWTEISVGDALTVLYDRLFGLNAGEVVYNPLATYEDNTVGKELQDLILAISDVYDPTKADGYSRYDFAIYENKLYRCTGSTSGNWDSTKWTELNAGEALTALYDRLFGLNAGQVAYNPLATYSNNTVGKELQDLSLAISPDSFGSRNKALFIGDSFNAGTGGTYGRGWGYFLQSISGCDATIIHQNGGGFTQQANNNATYPNETYIDLISHLIASDNFDTIVVQTGWNDGRLSTASSIDSAISSFMTGIKAKFPNAKVFIFATWWHAYPYPNHHIRLDTVFKSAIKYGAFSCCDSYWWIDNDEYNSEQTGHLNLDGYEHLARCMYDYLNGWDGAMNVQMDISSIVTPQDVNGTSYGYGPYAIVDKNTCTIVCDLRFGNTLSGGITDWTTLIANIPTPKYSMATQVMQDAPDFTQPLKYRITPDGNIKIRFGEYKVPTVSGVGNVYTILITYEVNLLNET